MHPGEAAEPSHDPSLDSESDSDKTMKGVKKQDLPTRPCAVCGRPFTWRKKWEKVWEEVKYCSERCRRSKAGAQNTGAMEPPAD